MSTPAQFRIATRIHFALKQWLGEGIDVSAMLTRPEEAREVLFVCQASGRENLVRLAREYTAAASPAARPAPPMPRTEAPQDAAWACDSSGFGLSQPAGVPLEPAPARTGWLRPAGWFRRSASAVTR